MSFTPDIGEFDFRAMSALDVEQVSALHARAFGPGRFARTAYRIREASPKNLPSRYCRLALHNGTIVATVTFTPVTIGGQRGALLLGPLVVDTPFANLGLGKKIVADSLAAAKDDGIKIVILVGDLAYYARMGFAQVEPGRFQFPGPVDPARILANELAAGPLGAFAGLISAAA